VEIIHEKFNLNNVLNEVSGTVCSQFKGSKVELIFDIDKMIPRYLIGDSLNLEKILNNLLEYVLGNVHEGEVTLDIEMFGTFEEKLELQFRLTDMGVGLDEQERESLFVPVYNEETKEYTGLGLFVAKSLTEMMGGELVVHSTPGKGTSFTITLPFEILDPSNRRNYRLPEKVLTEKKVLIVDRNYNAALAIKKMFAYFRHDVKVVSKEAFLQRMHNLKTYDIVVLDEVLFKPRIVEYLEGLKEETSLKVVALNALLEKDERSKVHKVIDRVLTKPANQERVFELIVNLFTPDRLEYPVKEDETFTDNPLTHRGEIMEVPRVTQQSFRDFNGMKLLIVEDDIINQKVLSNILKGSGIEIHIANNGREAVNMIKDRHIVFDMVLMDINMPIMDGYVATQMIRMENEFDRLPIVAFTALVLESEKEKIFRSGMNAYLTKPLSIGKLYAVFKMYWKVKEEKSVPLDEEELVYLSDVLDIRKGISYANHNTGFYIEILKEFIDAYGDTATLFEKLVKEHRYEQLKMLCIDMKGLTGTIGAKEMYGEIIEVHQHLLYKKETLLEKHIDSYAQKLERLKMEISRYLAH
jgi:CheY-like chemotaxis protein